MHLSIGDTAPDFEAQTTAGCIRFYEWIADSWCVLFSHPKDFTPVCTTELGYMARLKLEFDNRHTKVIGLSVDAVSDHSRWANDIKETQGLAPNYPIIGDPDLKVAKLYGMLPASASGDALKRTPADNQTVRNVFVIGPDKKIKLITVYPMATGRNFDKASGGDPGQLEVRRRRDHRRVGVRRGSKGNLSARLESAASISANCAPAEVAVGIRRQIATLGRTTNANPYADRVRSARTRRF